MPCNKCKRQHSGVCGIPAGVTLGFGARRVSGASPDTYNGVVEGQPKKTHRPSNQKSNGTLESLLAQAQTHYTKVLEQLKLLPAELPEYMALLDRESQLDALMRQLQGQIMNRRSAK